MESLLVKKNKDVGTNVLLIGNNPIDLHSIKNELEASQRSPFQIETAFDQKGVVQRLNHFRPAHILIDDNIGKRLLKNILDFLRTNNITRNVPITLLKNSNSETIGNTWGVDFMLKTNLSPQIFKAAFRNSERFMKTTENMDLRLQERKQLLSGIRH